MLFVLVLIFSSDMLDLMDKKMVEEQQEIFLLTLQKYLIKKFVDLSQVDL